MFHLLKVANKKLCYEIKIGTSTYFLATLAPAKL